MENLGEEFTHLKKGSLNTNLFVNNGSDESAYGELSKSFGKEEKDTFEKADVTRAFKSYYGDKQIRVSKTGKEIKEGLSKKKISCETKKQLSEDKCLSLLDALSDYGCSEKPNEVSWRTRENDDYECKIFDWRQKDMYEVPWDFKNTLKKEAKAVDSLAVSGDPVLEASDMQENKVIKYDSRTTLAYKKMMKIGNIMTDYNNEIEKLHGIIEDIGVIEVMVNNITDKSTHSLTVKQLQAAGL